MDIKRETERLLLRKFQSIDLDDMLEMTQQYEKSDMAKYDQQFPQTAEGMKEVIEMLRSGNSFAAVVLKNQLKVIGLIQFQKKENYITEVVHGFGYIFNSDFQGQGYATEACKAALTYLFEDLAIDRCTAGTAALNKKSRKLLERLGFKEVRQKPAHFRNDSKGKPIRFMSVIYELSKKDWQFLK